MAFEVTAPRVVTVCNVSELEIVMLPDVVTTATPEPAIKVACVTVLPDASVTKS